MVMVTNKGSVTSDSAAITLKSLLRDAAGSNIHPTSFPSLHPSPFAHALSIGFFFLVQGVWGTFFTPLALAAFVMAYGSLWEK
jgi:hypothetical protein